MDEFADFVPCVPVDVAGVLACIAGGSKWNGVFCEVLDPDFGWIILFFRMTTSSRLHLCSEELIGLAEAQFHPSGFCFISCEM